jgi:hypothetical protein
MKLRRVVLLGGAFLLVIFKFALDVVEKNVELGLMGLGLIRELLIIGSLGLLYVVIDVLASRRESTPVRKLGFVPDRHVRDDPRDAGTFGIRRGRIRREEPGARSP